MSIEVEMELLDLPGQFESFELEPRLDPSASASRNLIKRSITKTIGYERGEAGHRLRGLWSDAIASYYRVNRNGLERPDIGVLQA